MYSSYIDISSCFMALNAQPWWFYLSCELRIRIRISPLITIGWPWTEIYGFTSVRTSSSSSFSFSFSFTYIRIWQMEKLSIVWLLNYNHFCFKITHASPNFRMIKTHTFFVDKSESTVFWSILRSIFLLAWLPFKHSKRIEIDDTICYNALQLLCVHIFTFDIIGHIFAFALMPTANSHVCKYQIKNWWPHSFFLQCVPLCTLMHDVRVWMDRKCAMEWVNEMEKKK